MKEAKTAIIKIAEINIKLAKASLFLKLFL